MLRLGYTPKKWLASRVVYIPKEGKDDYTQVRSYRPISLTNTCFKVLERLVLWYLLDNSLVQRPMSVDQHGFRKGHSTATAISSLVDKIEMNIFRDNYALGVFLDIEGAFDNVTTEKVIAAMKRKNFPATIIRWYSHYLKNRCSFSTCSDGNVTRQLVKGTPQGGIMSPIIWNIVFDEFLDMFKDKNEPIRVHAYADDAALLVGGPDPHTLVNLMQQALKKAETWGSSAGLKFSASKTVAVLFTRKNNKTVDKLKLPLLKMSGQPIPYSKEVRYLGLDLTNSLPWGKHVTRKLASAKRLLAMLKHAIGKLWGPSPDSLHMRSRAWYAQFSYMPLMCSHRRCSRRRNGRCPSKG